MWGGATLRCRSWLGEAASYALRGAAIAGFREQRGAPQRAERDTLVTLGQEGGAARAVGSESKGPDNPPHEHARAAVAQKRERAYKQNGKRQGRLRKAVLSQQQQATR